MGFPKIPENLFSEFNFDEFNTLVIANEINFVNSLDDEVLKTLVGKAEGFADENERTKYVLATVHKFANMGLRLAPLLV